MADCGVAERQVDRAKSSVFERSIYWLPQLVDKSADQKTRIEHGEAPRTIEEDRMVIGYPLIRLEEV